MAFQTGLSGLNASSRSLDVIGNNIANANTTGMKASRTEFSDLIASSLSVSGSGGAGLGVALANISQQFTQGNITMTGNNLDVAINGSGFFQLKQADGSDAYTRDGAFKLDKEGFIKSNSNANLMGYPTDISGKPTSNAIQPLQLPTAAPIDAKKTSTITAAFNLDATAPLAVGVPAKVGPPVVAAVPITPVTTYGTSVTAYDSQGVGVPVGLYFVKIGPDYSASPPVLTDTWDIYDDNTKAAGTAALIANSAANADPVNNDPLNNIRATNAAQSTINASNTAVNKSNADLDAKNIAINAANAVIDTKNTALNLTNAGTTGWVDLPTYALGTIELLPTKAADGLSTFTTTDPAGKVLPMITSDLMPTFSAIGTGVYSDPAKYPTPTNTPLTGSVGSGALYRMEFDTTGKLIPTTTKPTLTLTSPNPTIGTFTATLDIGKVTQYGSAFAVSSLSQDGYTSGELTGLTIGTDGLINANYSNGQSQTAGQVSLADFRNVQGLTPLGGNVWAASYTSGLPVMGTPNVGKLGALRPGALEDSNVDLTSELVNMMTAQRAYQANAQTIKTQDQVLSTLVNLR